MGAENLILNEMKRQSLYAAPAALLLSVFLAGCTTPFTPNLSEAASGQRTDTGVRMGHTETGAPTEPSVEYVRVTMESAIFPEPPQTDNPSVYVRVRDTSGRDWRLQDAIAQRIRANGFRVVGNASQAEYALQANVLLANEVSALELAKLDETAYGQDVSKVVGSVLTGAALGGALTDALEGDKEAAVAGAVAGGLLGGYFERAEQAKRERRIQAQQYTKYYSVVVDIELRQRVQGGGVVRRTGQTRIANRTASGNAGESAGRAAQRTMSGRQSARTQEVDEYTETSDWKRSRTRVLGAAKGKLIAFEDVKGEFSKKLASAIAGML